MSSRVHAIHVAPGRKIPTRSVGSVEAEAGVGLVGDRYHGARHRHVTVQALDDWLGEGAMQALRSPRGGTVFRLLSSGTIRVGDEALVEVPRSG